MIIRNFFFSNQISLFNFQQYLGLDKNGKYYFEESFLLLLISWTAHSVVCGAIKIKM